MTNHWIREADTPTMSAFQKGKSCTGRASSEGGWIKAISPVMHPPSLKDNTADADRLVKGIRAALRSEMVGVDFKLIKRLPRLLRDFDFRVLALLYQRGECWHVFDILPAANVPSLYGLAVDLGTSTIVMRLLDLGTGDPAGESSFLNPQNDIGPDILTRIHHTSEEGGLERLRGLLMERMNREIARLAEKHEIKPGRIVAAAVAGNTTMTHLFLNLDPHWICREPYIPVVNRPPITRAADLGLKIHPEAPVLVFPNVGSYLGGDLVAGILASGMAQQDDISFLVDVGTNAEVVLGNRQWLLGCSGAAGPALEGGVATFGMMAGAGAIDRVTIDPDTGAFSVRTIENKPPVGICGSGLIDLVAQLFLRGMLDARGKFVEQKCAERLLDLHGIKQLVVVPSQDSGMGEDLTLTQPDIDALIRSKAAMYTILTTITSMINVKMGHIDRFYIAGTFGSYIDPQSAITLGMIPDLPLETYELLGNTSVAGASLVLLSAAARDEIDEIRDRITYIELNVNQEFMNLFSAAKFIPHTDRSLFPSVSQRVKFE
jgi:uncharacterized 2Fe-2S/4Fe-4S cluster protein (DUF4445 family)